MPEQTFGPGPYNPPRPQPTGNDWKKVVEELHRECGKLTGDPFIDEMLAKCIKTLEVKGNDYTSGAGQKDRLFNFREGAKKFKITQQQVLGVYLWKHLAAIDRYIAEGRVESEPIETRVMDAINYLLLLFCMIKNDELSTVNTIESPAITLQRPRDDVRLAYDDQFGGIVDTKVKTF